MFGPLVARICTRTLRRQIDLESSAKMLFELKNTVPFGSRGVVICTKREEAAWDLLWALQWSDVRQTAPII